MKTNDPLDNLLLQWQVPAEPSAAFRREVWGRIAVEGRSRASLLERLAALFFRPPVFACSLVLALGVGAFTSWSVLQDGQAVPPPQSQYLRSINPFDSTHLSASH